MPIPASPLTIVSLTRDAIAAAGAVALAVGLVLGLPASAVTGIIGAVRDLRSAGESPATGLTIAVTLTPPAYSGRSAVTVENPERLEVLEGSGVRGALISTVVAATLRSAELGRDQE